MADAKTAVARIDEWRKRVTAQAAGTKAEPFAAAEAFRAATDKALAHDLNINKALGVLFTFISATNAGLHRGQYLPREIKAIDLVWKDVDNILGLGDPETSVPAEVQSLADQRAAARKAKDFAASDTLRKQIESLGWKVKDTAKGQELTPA